MSFKLGCHAKVTIGTTKIGEVTAFSPSLAMDTVNTQQYGDCSPQPVVVTRTFTATVSGHLDPADAKQLQIIKTVLDSTSTDPAQIAIISNLRFYEDDTNYWTLLDPTEHFTITNYSWSPDLSGLVTFSFDVTANGLMQRTA